MHDTLLYTCRLTASLSFYEYFPGLKSISLRFSAESSVVNKSGNVKFIPVDKHLFNKSLIHCHAIITGGGFETPAEAIHLGKKVMAIPIRGQYEQCCNAAALDELNIMTLKTIDENFRGRFEAWMDCYNAVQLDYSKSIPQCIDKLFNLNIQ